MLSPDPFRGATRRSGRAALLIVVMVLLAATGAILFLPGSGDAPEDAELEAATSSGVSVLESGGAGPPEVTSVRSLDPEEDPEREAREGPSTVLWPLEVELELVRSSLLPDVPSGPPLGSGRTARLEGRITDGNGRGATASLRLVGGPNDGRVLQTSDEGTFGATDLYPGLDVLVVEGPRILGSRREIRLREGKVTEVNIGYATPGGAQGRVIDELGEAVEGATVTIDGRSGKTDRTGHFYINPIAAGRSVLVEIEHPDFAPHRANTSVALSITGTPRSLLYTLRKPATLKLFLETDVGGPEPAVVHLVPRHGGMNRDFPWYRVNPITIGPEPIEIAGLPAGEIEVRAFRTGAVGDPLRRRVSLSAGGTSSLGIRLRPTPLLTGRVLNDGQVVTGATVRLVAADPVDSTLRQFEGNRFSLEEEVLPMAPTVRSQAVTGGDGRFRLSANEGPSSWRLLEAIGPDGSLRALEAVGPNEREVDLELDTLEAGSASLVVELPRRFQAIGVELTVDGRPGDRFEVPSREDLVIDSLAPGVWKVDVRWRGQSLESMDSLRIEGQERLRVALPEDAILGQDRDTWLRAGRRWPLD